MSPLLVFTLWLCIHRYCDDVQLMSSHGHVRTRLYFTSESHIHSVVNALRLGNLFNVRMYVSTPLFFHVA